MLLFIRRIYIFIIVCMAVALRSIISLHSYSGAATPPMYGDYEAQRHWQEVTVNIPVSDWYKNSTDNDLMYWGLDYPPLTAYHSYVVGSIGKKMNNTFVALHASRGYESKSHKSFMRLSVLIADVLIYVPAMLLLILYLQNTFHKEHVLSSLVIALLYPGQMLIDNGHFQYNNISLGFAAFAIAMIIKKRLFIASTAFALALNYKQMELYHALPFFFYLLRQCWLKDGFLEKIRTLLKIGGIVMLVFMALWLPWLFSADSLTTVVMRLFPLKRGLFEDKVANVWCALNTIYKIKEKYSMEQMGLICLVTTLTTVLPINLHLFKNGKIDVFLYALTNTAMSFFLTSYQVHEKSILLVALPAICIYQLKGLEVFWFLELTTFSMLSLFLKDKLALPFFALFYIYHLLFQLNIFGSCTAKVARYYYIVHLFCLCIALAHIFAPSPASLPHIWPLLTAVTSCAGFLVFFGSSILSQFSWLSFMNKEKIIQ